MIKASITDKKDKVGLFDHNAPFVSKRTCWRVRPNEDSDQSAHPRSLIRVVGVRMKKLCIFAIQNVSNENFNQTARMRRLIWNFTGRTCPEERFLTL